MSASPELPLDLHQVLEEEYISMYGPLPDNAKPKTAGADYGRDDVLTAAYVAAALERFEAYLPPAEGEDEKDAVVRSLNALVRNVAPDSDANPSTLFRACSALSGGTVQLMREYADYNESQRQTINRRILDENFSGGVRSLRDARLHLLYRELHVRAAADPRDARTALCISGGGIRSATFALGVIQGLSTLGHLKRFDYLSTVSGGGYIGSWLSSWVRRHPDGIEGVEKDLADKPSEIVQKLDPEAKPVRHLRQYSNYLSPRLGLLSADTWTMGALYIRNLLLNWLVLVPLFAAGLALPRAFAWMLHRVTPDHLPLVFILGFTGLALGFGYLGFSRPVKHGAAAERDLGFLGRLSANVRFVWFCLAPLIVAAVAMALFWAVAQKHHLTPEQWSSVSVPALLLMTLLPGSIYFARFLRAPFSARRESAMSGGEKVKRILLEAAATISSGLVGIGLLFLFAKEVFDLPTAPLPELDDMLPFERPVLWMDAEAELYICLAVPLILLTFFIQASIFVGIAGRRNQDYDREWWGRAGAWLLIAAAVTAVASLTSVFGPLAVYQAPALVASIGGVSGLIALTLGRSGKTPANAKQKEESGAAARTSNVALAFAVPLFVLFLLAIISVGTTFLVQEVSNPVELPTAGWEREAKFETTVAEKITTSHITVENKTAAEPLESVALMKGLAHLRSVRETTVDDLRLFGLFLVVGLLFSLFVGVNRFSMHALYRNRLIRAYLGASRYSRDPDRFTGFDPNDNIHMHELRPELLWASSFHDIDRFVSRLVSVGGAGSRSLWQTGIAAVREPRITLSTLWNRESPAATPRETGPGAVLRAVWEHIDGDTRSRMRAGGKLGTHLMDATLQQLNLVLDTVELPGVAPADGRSLAMRNRELLDSLFADCIRKVAAVRIRVATQPEGAPVPAGHRSRPPLHIVNMALNLVSGQNLAWQQRKAQSFTCSPLHAGSPFVGYRQARTYGGSEGVSLGTAVTISGAAASPNMGYHSSPALGFILTLFNVRLGWWLGNPGPAGRRTGHLSDPGNTLVPMMREVVGKTDDRSPYVYLSDGGHF